MNWDLNLSPLPVQAEAIKNSRGNRGFAFFMEPGMGKTGTVMAEFLLAQKKDVVDLMVVICPNNLRQNWKSEAEKMGFPFDVAIYPEPAPETGMWIFNYEKVTAKPFDDLEAVLRSRKVYAVCDESHRIKNFKAKVSKAVVYLFDFAVLRRVMTGTPVANNVVDLWSQLRAIGQHGTHRSPYTFRNRYGVMGGWMGKQVVGTQREDELKDILNSCSFVAKKSKWMASLPPKAYYSLGYEMNKKQMEAYRIIYRDRFLMHDDKEITAQMVITALMKMQQVTSGFMMDDNGDVVEFCDDKNPKIDAIKDIIQDITSKVIIFAHYKHTINALDKAMNAMGKWLVIRGEMDREDVGRIVNNFNTDNNIDGIIIQTSTGKEGLTLLGTAERPCHTTIYAENTYSIIDRSQSEDRNHRHGQVADQVSYYDLVGSKIESKIISALQQKKDLVKTVMENRNE